MVCEAQIQDQIRVFSLKTQQDLIEKGIPQTDRRGQCQSSMDLLMFIAQRRFDAFEAFEPFAALAVIVLPRFGQTQATGAALKQAQAKPGFEQLNRSADAGLAGVEVPRHCRKAPPFSHPAENVHLFEPIHEGLYSYKKCINTIPNFPLLSELLMS